MTGCLLGPPVEGLPQEELYPPIIDLDQVVPAMEGPIPVLNASYCIMERFSLGKVTDQNVGDTLTVRWLLDWKGRDKPDGILTDHNILPTGSVDRFDPYALDLEFQLSRITSDLDKAHTITAVVADRPLVNSSAIGFADNEDGQEGRFDLYQWTIELGDSGLCDQEK